MISLVADESRLGASDTPCMIKTSTKPLGFDETHRMPDGGEMEFEEVTVPDGHSAGPVAFGFSEDMRGKVKTADGQTHAVAFHLSMAIQDLGSFVADAAHVAKASGYVDMPSLGGKCAVSQGRFQLFPVNPITRQREMRYELPFNDHAGNSYVLCGTKYVHDDQGLDLWRDLTTLDTSVLRADGSTFAKGVLRLGPADVVKLASTFDAPEQASFWGKAKAVFSFARFFLGEVWNTYVSAKFLG